MTNIKDFTFDRFKSYFESIGFYNSVHLIHNDGYEFYKTQNNLIYVISLGYIKKGKKISINNSVYSWIKNEDTNKILNKFSDIQIDREHLLMDFPFFDKKFGDKNLNNIETLPIDTEDEFEIVKKILSNHIKTYITPFFDKVIDLQAINNEVLNKVPQSDYTKYIKGSTTFKVLIIMKLCNNPKFDDYKAWALEAYRKELASNPERWTKLLESLESLVAYLDSGNYKKDLV